jgi:hypothetical protein
MKPKLTQDRVTVPRPIVAINHRLYHGATTPDNAAKELSRHEHAWNGVRGQFGDAPVRALGGMLLDAAGQELERGDPRRDTPGKLGGLCIVSIFHPTETASSFAAMPKERKVIAAELHVSCGDFTHPLVVPVSTPSFYSENRVVFTR